MTGHAPLAEVVRGEITEGLHYGSVVILAPDGSVKNSIGEVVHPMYPRSANKPAQIVGMLRAGLKLDDDADVALAAASHNAEAAHLVRARELLNRHDLGEDALRCPTDWPLLETERDQRASEGFGKSRITMNCSGKHSAMLATCVQRNWSTADYLDPKHPLQQTLGDTVSELAGEPISATTVDGCGAPLFAISLHGLARSFATLVTTPRGDAPRRVADAMRAQPWMVAGTGREDTDLMRAVPGLVSKSGVEGVLAMALADGHAIAIKIADGSARAGLPVAVAALRSLGISGAGLEASAEHTLYGGGAPVGTVRALDGLFD